MDLFEAGTIDWRTINTNEKNMNQENV